jgi:hypothetical protein
MPPRATSKALRGNADAIVVVVALAMSVGAWPPERRHARGQSGARVARLRAVRPDLEDEFWTAIDAALAAAMLRWSDAAGGGDLPLLRTAASPSRRVRTAVAAVHRHAAPAV